MKRTLLLLLAAGGVHAQPLNPDVTPETIETTICVPGWTAKVRPPVSVTNRIKHQKMDEAGISWDNAEDLELDHHVPLALGGAPADPDNLWLQAWDAEAPAGWKVESDAHTKDRLERRLQLMVCRGELPLDEAQRCIWTDWRACANKYPR